MTTAIPEPTLPDHDELWRLYEQAVDEYRFQVNLNWQRLQYFLGLDVAVLGVATGLMRIGGTTRQTPSDVLPGLVFISGVLLSLASVFLAWRQHEYYRGARDQVKKLRDLLGIRDYGIVTTAGHRDASEPWWTKVRSVVVAILVVIAMLNAVGAGYAFVQ